MTPYQAQRAAKIARARELRAQGLPLKAIRDTMLDEGIQISLPSISQYTSDIDAPEHRGRRPVHATEAERDEARRKAKRKWYHRHAERLNREAREARANESEAERAERRELQRIKYHASK